MVFYFSYVQFDRYRPSKSEENTVFKTRITWPFVVITPIVRILLSSLVIRSIYHSDRYPMGKERRKKKQKRKRKNRTIFITSLLIEIGSLKLFINVLTLRLIFFSFSFFFNFIKRTDYIFYFSLIELKRNGGNWEWRATMRN